MTITETNNSRERLDHGSRGVTVLGSTGSIGINALDVLARHPGRYRILALTANTQVDRLFDQCRQFLPQKAVMLDPRAATRLREKIRDQGLDIDVLSGVDGLNTVATHQRSHIVVAAIVGAAGLLPTLNAVRAGKRVLLANKESLVMSGHVFIEESQRFGAELLPVDSEHNAIFQCMPDGFRAGTAAASVRRIFLTCSGGPFRGASPESLVSATPEQACAHPNWVMGRKISVDSATLMNKGLELIEACWLFGVSPDQIEIVIHPQSVIHSLVEYIDGSVLAQLGYPDMRTPIAHALAWPERIESGVKSLNLFEVARLDFESPDLERFPCLRLAYDAARGGGTMPAILNAANEVAVQAFLDRRIGFTNIPHVIEHALSKVSSSRDNRLETVLSDDMRTRDVAASFIASREPRMRQGAT
ncbi:MAG: 1-deoxy-D-xylulose-5-phosphate reductoisomerase [Gammaproteobacteria bacterium]|nr:1-deoxy-D-xylulose-5-phosphate reductoisomerase [Gammaproteobacteria bacterium]MDH5511617.1 1-deoxy-D-xylulose-5-phosphate reductoisomerase [Gammaproteobacteria bacterium]